MALQFTAVLDQLHREELEELMFQHPQQGRFRDTILDCIERFGVPRVVEQNGRLRIELAGQTEVQTLYAVLEGSLDSGLVGALVFTRNEAGELVVLHIAVKDEYTAQGPRADQMVTFALLEELCRVARHIRGVPGVRLAYTRGHTLLKTIHPLQFAPASTGECPSPERGSMIVSHP
jgi:hypothetical protein